MAKLTKYIIGVALSALFTWQPLCYARTVTEKMGATDTGITSNTSNTSHGKKKVKEAVIFTTYDFGTTTAVYNNAGGSAVTSGWIDVRDFSDDIIFHVNLATKGSTGLDITFQGMLSNDTAQILDIYTESFTAVDTGYVTHLSEGALKYVRVKGQATGTDGTNVCSVNVRAEGIK